MRAIVLTTMGFFTLTVTSALAGDTTACWTYGTPTGVFDWQQSPSLACRAGRTVDGSALAAPASALAGASPGTATAAKNAAKTTITFSGAAYVGVAATF